MYIFIFVFVSLLYVVCLDAQLLYSESKETCENRHIVSAAFERQEQGNQEFAQTWTKTTWQGLWPDATTASAEAYQFTGRRNAWCIQGWEIY